MSKIRILHIIKSLGRGGAEMLLPETLKLHNNQKFEFHYVYFLPWKDQMVSAIEQAGGKVYCLEAENNIQLFLKSRDLIRFCKEKNIDLIHSHLPWSGFLGRFVHRRTGIPMVYTEHNVQERYHFVTRNINKRTFDFQNVALGVSEDVTTSVMKNINPKIPVRTLLNGVNTEKFKRDPQKGMKIRSDYDIPLDALVIGNVAVFRKQKAIPTWLEAFARVYKQEAHVFGLLVGAGPEEEEIESTINQLGLSKRIILTGLKTDTVGFFSAMDIFMMSSDFEGLPVALLEAMSMNCPIVSTRAGGVEEVVRPGVEGLLSEPGKPEGLAQNALSLITNPEKREVYGIAARDRVEKQFSLHKMVINLEGIYEEVINEN